MLGAEHLARLLALVVDERDEVRNGRHGGVGVYADERAALYACSGDGGGEEENDASQLRVRLK